MTEGSPWRAVIGHSMRAYYLPIAAGALLSLSALLPWIRIDDTRTGGVPDLAGLWILGLGLAAIVLAALSIRTRKNSRHPILVVGLIAFGIQFLALQVMGRSAVERAWAASQAAAIVAGGPAPPAPVVRVDSGLYLGLAASTLLVLFGLTIVLRRANEAYALSEDDDV